MQKHQKKRKRSKTKGTREELEKDPIFFYNSIDYKISGGQPAGDDVDEGVQIGVH